MKRGTVTYRSSRRAFLRVRRLRKMRGWSAEELARRTCEQGFQVNRQMIANGEMGRRDVMSVDELLAFAAAFEVPPLSLVSRCEVCKSAPPPGFICSACGEASEIAGGQS